MGYLNISSVDSWSILRDETNSQLVDVRTKEEWKFVGFPDLSSLGKEVKKISFFEYPEMKINDHFLEVLEKEKITKSDKVIFICRSGGRSAMAAEFAATNGYINCYNAVDGFEGELNPATKHRGEVEGWIFSQLPWEQS